MITIDLGGSFVTYLVMISLAVYGWNRGFRYMTSIALLVTLGYLLTVQGGNFLVDLINRVYVSLPRLFSFLLGQDPGGVTQFDPIIPQNLEAPLFLRFLVFLALLVLGITFTFPWEGKPLGGFSGGNQVLRVLGGLAGLYTGMIILTAFNRFWSEAGAVVEVPPQLATVFSSLPNWSSIVPSAVAAFLVTILIIMLIRFNRIWAPDPPPARK